MKMNSRKKWWKKRFLSKEKNYNSNNRKTKFPIKKLEKNSKSPFLKLVSSMKNCNNSIMDFKKKSSQWKTETTISSKIKLMWQWTNINTWTPWPTCTRSVWTWNKLRTNTTRWLGSCNRSWRKRNESATKSNKLLWSWSEKSPKKPFSVELKNPFLKRLLSTGKTGNPLRINSCKSCDWKFWDWEISWLRIKKLWKRKTNWLKVSTWSISNSWRLKTRLWMKRSKRETKIFINWRRKTPILCRFWPTLERNLVIWPNWMKTWLPREKIKKMN